MSNVDALYDPEDGKLDLNRIKGRKRYLVAPVFGLLALAAIGLLILNIMYVATPLARHLDFNNRYIFEAIMLVVGIFGVQVFLILPFEVVVWVKGHLKGAADNHLNLPLRKLKTARWWRYFGWMVLGIVLKALFIKEALFLYFGRPQVVMMEGQAYYAYQGGWTETILFMVLLIMSFIYVPKVSRKLRACFGRSKVA